MLAAHGLAELGVDPGAVAGALELARTTGLDISDIPITFRETRRCRFCNRRYDEAPGSRECLEEHAIQPGTVVAELVVESEAA